RPTRGGASPRRRAAASQPRRALGPEALSSLSFGHRRSGARHAGAVYGRRPGGRGGVGPSPPVTMRGLPRTRPGPMTSRAIQEDVETTRPGTSISLSKAGVSRSAKAIRIRHDGSEQLFQAEVSCSVDLNPIQKGVHMSRFEEEVNEAIDEVLLSQALRIEALAERIAERVIDGQRALQSEVLIRASYPLEKRTPVTDIPTQEMYGLIGMAVANMGTSRRLVGVTAQGMNACPCAQGLIRDQAAAGLREDGFDEAEIARVLARVPVATHNQRARGTLFIGAPESADVRAEVMLEIVEESMSSEIYELMNRPDERYVVDRSHRRP